MVIRVSTGGKTWYIYRESGTYNEAMGKIMAIKQTDAKRTKIKKRRRK
jgi:hypothetical protein